MQEWFLWWGWRRMRELIGLCHGSIVSLVGDESHIYSSLVVLVCGWSWDGVQSACVHSWGGWDGARGFDLQASRLWWLAVDDRRVIREVSPGLQLPMICSHSDEWSQSFFPRSIWRVRSPMIFFNSSFSLLRRLCSRIADRSPLDTPPVSWSQV